MKGHAAEAGDQGVRLRHPEEVQEAIEAVYPLASRQQEDAEGGVESQVLQVPCPIVAESHQGMLGIHPDQAGPAAATADAQGCQLLLFLTHHRRVVESRRFESRPTSSQSYIMGIPVCRLMLERITRCTVLNH